jgi:hypothetical protein
LASGVYQWCCPVQLASGVNNNGYWCWPVMLPNVAVQFAGRLNKYRARNAHSYINNTHRRTHTHTHPHTQHTHTTHTQHRQCCRGPDPCADHAQDSSQMFKSMQMLRSKCVGMSVCLWVWVGVVCVCVGVCVRVVRVSADVQITADGLIHAQIHAQIAAQMLRSVHRCSDQCVQVCVSVSGCVTVGVCLCVCVFVCCVCCVCVVCVL